jgi:uncharacterized protein (DUF305 family)
MFVGSFIIQYFLIPPIMVSENAYITNNIGKAYMAVIMGLFMVVLEIMMHDHEHNMLSLNLYAIFIVILALFVYLYRKQVAIDDKQYLEGMIEHHSMGIFTSEEILKKTDNYEVAKIAKNIIQTQNDELRTMRELINK